MNMNIVAGDKVKFVNEKGFGVVTKIFSSSKVMVAIEDGFEIPYLVSDLIKVIENGTSSNMFNTDKINSINEQIQDNIDSDYEENSYSTSLNKNKLLEYEKDGVYLAFVPQNQRLLSTGNIDIFLINHTETELLYTIYLQGNKGKYYAKSYGIVESESKLLLETIDNSLLNKWSEGFMQFIYFNQNSNNITKPVNEEFQIKAYKTFNAENYKVSPFFEDEKCVTISLNIYQNQEQENNKDFITKEDAESLAKKMQTKQKPKDNNKETFITKYIKDKDFAEVDMHIWELVDNSSRLSPTEIFRIQMEFFNKCLESALSNRLKKVVFIHGVGNGSLKKEIRAKLEADYPEITVYDAPMAIYGIGATEINIPYNYKI